MPFTISHAALVLPFARPLARWRLLSAMVIGSMVPDFGLFMPLRPDRSVTHSALGLLTFCLPLGVATFWLFQLLLKRPVMAVLPDGAYTRWRRFAAPADIASLAQWAFAAGGVLVGAASHLVWDAFTHEGARGVRMIPMLDDPVVDIGGHRLAGVRLLQDVSSLIGLLIVLALIAYALRPDHGSAVSPPRLLTPRERHLWMFTYAALALVLASAFLLLRHAKFGWTHSVAVIVGNTAVAALRGCAAALVAVSLFLTARLRASRLRSARSDPA